MNDYMEENVLDKLNKSACMGMDASHFGLEKAKDDRLRTELNSRTLSTRN